MSSGSTRVSRQNARRMNAGVTLPLIVIVTNFKYCSLLLLNLRIIRR